MCVRRSPIRRQPKPPSVKQEPYDRLVSAWNDATSEDRQRFIYAAGNRKAFPANAPEMTHRPPLAYRKALRRGQPWQPLARPAIV